MLKEAEKEKKAQIVEKGENDKCYEGNGSQAEDENVVSEGQCAKDSEATLKLQLELEKITAMRSETDAKSSETDAKRVEMELLMQREWVTLSADQSGDRGVRSDENGGQADVRHLFPRMSDTVDFDCLSFFHSLEVTFNVNGVAKCMWPKLLQLYSPPGLKNATPTSNSMRSQIMKKL